MLSSNVRSLSRLPSRLVLPANLRALLAALLCGMIAPACTIKHIDDTEDDSKVHDDDRPSKTPDAAESSGDDRPATQRDASATEDASVTGEHPDQSLDASVSLDAAAPSAFDAASPVYDVDAAAVGLARGVEVPPEHAGGRTITLEEVEQFSACFSGPDEISAQHLLNVNAALASVDDDVVEVPLSANGCLRVVQEVIDGVVETEALIGFTGQFGDPVIDGTDVTVPALYSTLGRWVRDDDGTVRGVMDNDGKPADTNDTFYEIRTAERDGYYQIERHNPSSQELEDRYTAQTSDVEVALTLEEMQGGELQTESVSFAAEATLLSAPGVSPFLSKPLTAEEIDKCIAKVQRCSEDMKKEFDSAMVDALTKAVDCLGGKDSGSSWDRMNYLVLKALRDSWGKGAKRAWGCMPAGCDFAFTKPSASAFAIGYGLDLWAAQDANKRQATLAHEIFHHLFGNHEPWFNESSSANERIRAYADQTYGCQEYCFNPNATQCDCASCFDTTLCDERCEFMPNCEENCGGAADCKNKMSSDLAAFISGPANSPSVQWFMSMDECKELEALTEGTCRSFNRECKPSE